MPLDRRQFFRRFLPGDKTSEQRLGRYDALETYVRTRLLPYDFSLTEAQERELLSDVRALLEKMSNDELFSTAVRGRIEEVVEAKIEPWRMQTDVKSRAERIREVRLAAPDYVSTFLNANAGSEIIEQLKENYGIYDMNELEELLKRQIESWVRDVDDRLMQQYDVVSVQELVFAQVRSWC